MAVDLLTLILVLLPNLVVASLQYNCVVTNVTGDEFGAGLCHYCYTSWLNIDNKPVIQQQGCFNYDGPEDAAEECLSSQCLNLVDSGESNDKKLRFCCCIGDFCNKNFSTSQEVENLKFNRIDKEEIVNGQVSLFFGVSLCFIALVVYIVVLSKIFSRYKMIRFFRPFRRQRSTSEEDDVEADSKNAAATSTKIATHQLLPDLCQINFSDFDLNEKVVLGDGRFGSTLYRATGGGNGSKSTASVLSVKVFTQSQKQGYFNEKELYDMIKSASKSNPDIKYAFLQFFETKEKVTLQDGSTYDYMIGLEHNSRGFLCDFLQNNTISWTDLCKMLTTISNGLSYLHSGFGSNKGASSYGHRNINSRNILVRSDLSCCLCNFENSTVVSSAHSKSNGGSRDDNEKSPMLSSSSSVMGSPRYLAPEILENTLNLYDSESSLKHIDVYAMGLVFWELSRRCHDLYQGVPVPSFELAFHLELAGASCTFDQMKLLIVRKKVRPLFPEVWKNSNPAIQSLRETIEDSWDHDGEARVTAFCVLERARELSVLWERYISTHHRIANNVNVNLKSDNRPGAIIFESNSLELTNNHVETSKVLSTKNDNVLSQQQPLKQLQPHQGRNPCMERNNYLDSVSTNLVQGSVKDKQMQHQNAPSPDDSVTVRRLSHQRPPRVVAQPIPYLQNDFSQAEPSGQQPVSSKGKFFFRNKATLQQSKPKEPKSNNLNYERERQQLLLRGSEQPSCSSLQNTLSSA